MGYNLQDVSGNPSGGPDNWAFTLDLSNPAATSVTGDFSMTSVLFGTREATDGYGYAVTQGGGFGTLSGNTSTGAYTFTVDRSAVFASGDNQVVQFNVTGTDNGNTFTDVVTVNILICLSRGTCVDTERGAVPVEALRLDDMVLTHDGPPQPLRWIGSRRLAAAELAAKPHLRPIVIRRGAFGPDMPRRDLSVSPNHRIVLSDWRAALLFGEQEVLVPAKTLVNDRSILCDHGGRAVEYFHLLFDEHQVIYTEGLPTESFHPGSYTLGALDSERRAELAQLFPELAADDGGYGQTARTALRNWEARVLVTSQSA